MPSSKAKRNRPTVKIHDDSSESSDNSESSKNDPGNCSEEETDWTIEDSDSSSNNHEGQLNSTDDDESCNWTIEDSELPHDDLGSQRDSADSEDTCNWTIEDSDSASINNERSSSKPSTLSHLVKSGSKFDKKTILAACERLKEGASTTTVAQEFNCSIDTARKWRREYARMLSREVPSNVKRYKKKTILHACERLKKGDSVSDVATKLKIGRPTVKNWYDRYVVQGKPIGANRDKFVLINGRKVSFARTKKQDASEPASKNIHIVQNDVTKGKPEKESKKNSSDEWKPSESDSNSDAVKEHGGTSRKLKKFDKTTIRQVLKRLKKGDLPRDIAKDIGCSSQRIAAWRNRYLLSRSESETEEDEIPKMPIKLNHIGPRGFNKRTIRKALRRLQGGHHPADIAKDIGCTADSIRKWHRRYLPESESDTEDAEILNIPLRVRHKSQEKPMRKALRRLKAGHSAEDIAKDNGFTVETIKKWERLYLRHHSSESDSDLDDEIAKIPITASQKFSKKVMRNALRRLVKGDFPKDIAKDIGSTVRTVWDWRRLYLPTVLENVAESQVSQLQFQKNLVVEACNQLKQGVSIQVVAEELDVDAKTVEEWKNKYIKKGDREVKLKLGKRHNPDTINQVCQRVKNGETLADISKELGIPVRTMQNWIFKHKDGKPELIQDGRKYSKQTIIEACNRLRQGQSVKQIAKELGVNPGSVQLWKREYVKTCQGPTSGIKYHKSTVIEACNRLKLGEPMKIVAKELGVNITTVKTWRRRFVMNEQFKMHEFEPEDESKEVAKPISKVCEKLKGGMSPEAEKNILMRKRLAKRLSSSEESDVEMLSQSRGTNFRVLVNKRKRNSSDLETDSEMGTKTEESNLVDSKLKMKPVVVLVKNIKIDALCLEN